MQICTSTDGVVGETGLECQPGAGSWSMVDVDGGLVNGGVSLAIQFNCAALC